MGMLTELILYLRGGEVQALLSQHRLDAFESQIIGVATMTNSGFGYLAFSVLKPPKIARLLSCQKHCTFVKPAPRSHFI